MMNKGLEVIEASYLFALAPDEIDVLVHPQSIIHGMVEFSDRSVMAQLGAPDMRTPIAHCLGWPDRIVGRGHGWILPRSAQLTFEAPDSPGSRAAARLRGAAHRPRRDDRVQRGERGGGGGLRCAKRSASAASRASSRRRSTTGSERKSRAADKSADDAISVDHNARNRAAALLPQIALKAS